MIATEVQASMLTEAMPVRPVEQMAEVGEPASSSSEGHAGSHAPWRAAVALTPLLLAACGGGDDGDGLDPTTRAQVQGMSVDPYTGLVLVGSLPGSATPEPARAVGLTEREAARLLTQATFGIRSGDDLKQLQEEGVAHWLWRQFRMPCALHTSYLDQQRYRNDKARANEEMSYEAIWRQWLFEDGQLRGRVAFALSHIMVISNVAPDIKPYAMSSYMDLLNRNAFGNFRTLLKEVTLHPAMGYYLNMLQSKKEDPKSGTHPNENYAREVLQLFSIGLAKLDFKGNVRQEAGKPIPAFGEAEVKGFAKAFSGWSFGGEGNADPKLFYKAKHDHEPNWVVPMLPFASQHDMGAKQLLDGRVLPAGQPPEKDMDDAIDSIFSHPNVGPFVGRQLIQRLVTSNPSPDYIEHVARAFEDNGQGVRGDLRAVIQAILTFKDARDGTVAAQANYGKQREPVIRMANMLRAFNATTPSPAGRTELHYLDSPDESLGQSPLLAPSVFNFFSPNYRQAGAMARANLVAPEFQITTESSVVGCFNTFARLFKHGGYGWGKESRLALNFMAWDALVLKPEELVDRMSLLLCNGSMSAATRQRLLTMLQAMPTKSWQLRARIEKAFTLLAVSPDFVIQK
jgi:uncharacterized protein (DUF1800 family)